MLLHRWPGTRALVRSSSTAAAALLLLGACASTPTGETSGAPAAEPVPELACSFSGTWTQALLRLPDDGRPYGTVWGGQADVRIPLGEGPPRLAGSVEKRGWVLLGEGRLDDDDALRAHGARWLTPWLGVAAEAGLLAAGARPGAVLVERPRYAFSSDDGFRFAEPPRAWLRCEELTLAFRMRLPDPGERRARHLEELGLPPVEGLAEIYVPADAEVTLRASPEGEPIGALGPRNYDRRAWILEERGGLAKLLFHGWPGAALVVWTERDALRDPEPKEGGGKDLLGMIGSMKGDEPDQVCTSTDDQEVFVSAEDLAPTSVGAVKGGTEFLLLSDEGAPAGQVFIRPGRHSGVSPTIKVRWSIPEGDFACREEVYDPLGGLGDGKDLDEALSEPPEGNDDAK